MSKSFFELFDKVSFAQFMAERAAEQTAIAAAQAAHTMARLGTPAGDDLAERIAQALAGAPGIEAEEPKSVIDKWEAACED